MISYMARDYFKKVTDFKVGSHLELNIYQVLIHGPELGQWTQLRYISVDKVPLYIASATFDTKKIDPQRIRTNIHLKECMNIPLYHILTNRCYSRNFSPIW